MSEFIDIVNIKGDWTGGNHPEFPKIFGIGQDKERPFCVSEGSGWASAGACFNLSELFEREVAQVFDRDESKHLYERLVQAYSVNKNSYELALELLKEFG